MPRVQSPLMWQNPCIAEGRVLIEPEPLALINQYRQDHQSKPEAGGILLGYRREGHLHVTMATVPQPSDRRMRFWFSRATKHHQQEAVRHWMASNAEVDYLGEWHTHPEGRPSPSSLDRTEWRKIACERTSPMVFMILGWTGELWVGVSCDSGSVKPCTVQIEQ